jgi:hypothetical protein
MALQAAPLIISPTMIVAMLSPEVRDASCTSFYPPILLPAPLNLPHSSRSLLQQKSRTRPLDRRHPNHPPHRFRPPLLPPRSLRSRLHFRVRPKGSLRCANPHNNHDIPFLRRVLLLRPVPGNRRHQFLARVGWEWSSGSGGVVVYTLRQQRRQNQQENWRGQEDQRLSVQEPRGGIGDQERQQTGVAMQLLE